MCKNIKKLVWVIAIMAQMICGGAMAQDVKVNFVNLYYYAGQPPYTTDNGVTFTWMNYAKGAAIYMNEKDAYSLKISSPDKKIVRIEFNGKISGSTYTDEMSVRDSKGRLTHMESGTFVWEGSENTLQIWGASNKTYFYIEDLRLWFEGSDINTDEKGITATPEIGVDYHKLHFMCKDTDTTFTYSVLPKTAEDGEHFDRVLVTVQAAAPGKEPSEIVKKEIPMKDFDNLVEHSDK